ncbi:MAG: hypothetical protein IT426_18635 [Pirellulales bacterium]|nr:hypothetical protein [Pirellulales bacterium]
MDITIIPSIMRRKNWLNGARLQDIWFSQPANASPAAGTPETQTIRMDSWALTFSRCKQVYDAMIRNRVWRSEEGRKNIGKWLSQSGRLSMQRQSFGNLNQSVPALNREFIYESPVGSLFDSLDDMYAALGKFNLRVVVAGSVSGLTMPTVSSRRSRFLAQIDRVGIYIFDSFDFNGFQPLGFWSAVYQDVSVAPSTGYDLVQNSDYRDWRAKNNRGGDFYVFSDLKVITLNPPDTFELPPDI